MTMYIYEVIREHPDGTQGKRRKKLYQYRQDLKVGGLYLHLGWGFPGMQRVLSMKTKEVPG